jgi:hypothetical protein
MPSKTHNPERSAWRGRSYKKGGKRVSELRRDSEPSVTPPAKPARLGFAEIAELEEDIIEVARRLREGIEADGSVTRDMMGTLHVNLSALVRVAEKTIAALETEYGFMR